MDVCAAEVFANWAFAVFVQLPRVIGMSGVTNINFSPYSKTFTSSTGAIEASKVILHELTNENYLGKHGKTAAIHGYFARKFRQLSKKYPDTFSDLRGVGSMIAFQVFQGKRDPVIQFIHDCFDEGLICFIAGNNPTYVRFLLPIGGITNTHMDEALSIMERCIHKQKETQS